VSGETAGSSESDYTKRKVAGASEAVATVHRGDSETAALVRTLAVFANYARRTSNRRRRQTVHGAPYTYITVISVSVIASSYLLFS